MSSHHIVREKQEPALLILGLRQFADEQLGQLLEWSPTVLVTAEMAEQLESRSIKVDVIISSCEDEAAQPGVKFIRESEPNPVLTALNYLVAGKYPTVNIVTDEAMIAGYLAFADQINMVIYCGDQKIYPVHSGFSKWKPAGETIRILSESPDLVVTGLMPIGQNTYQTIADGFFSLAFSAAFMFVSETIV